MGQGGGIRIYEALGAPSSEWRAADSMRVVTPAGDSSVVVFRAPLGACTTSVARGDLRALRLAELEP